VFVLTVLAGIGFGGVLPLTISLSQKLLPHRTSLASGLMMGGAWAVGSAGPPLADWLTKHIGLDGAFLVVAGLLAVGGAAAIGIPGWLIRKVS
jgi:MFS family permease